MPTVGILALQGDFEAHGKMLDRLGAATKLVRTPEDLNGIDGLVIPGGESTTMLKLLDATGLEQPIRDFGAQKPIFGTCAGAILLARDVKSPEQRSLDLVDIGVERNAYGRQLNSRLTHLVGLPGGDLEALFIRAPAIRRVGEGTTVLLRYAGDPVLVDAGRHLVATFHPELTGDTRVHKLFLDKL